MRSVLIKQSSNLFAQYVFFLSTGLLVLICFFSKTTLFLGANPVHTPALDQVFTYLTCLGDGLMAALLAAGCFIAGKKMIAAKLLTTFALSGLVAQLFKQLVGAPRPKAFFAPDRYQHFIDGVTHSGFNSFPSGHATTVFAVATLLSFHVRGRVPQTVLFFAAVLIAYSRVYLGQHFVEDVVAGMIIGIVSSFGVEYLFRPRTSKISVERTVTNISYEQQPSAEL
jgi:membrane-associated phospholipid phosphatase